MLHFTSACVDLYALRFLAYTHRCNVFRFSLYVMQVAKTLLQKYFDSHYAEISVNYVNLPSNQCSVFVYPFSCIGRDIIFNLQLEQVGYHRNSECNTQLQAIQIMQIFSQALQSLHLSVNISKYTGKAKVCSQFKACMGVFLRSTQIYRMVVLLFAETGNSGGL